MQLLKALWALAGAAICCFLVFVIHAQFLKEDLVSSVMEILDLTMFQGQLAAGTCEIVTLDRDSSQPRRTIARQTARCACKKGQIAGTTRARPACVDARIIKTKQWCEMLPCLEGEGCDLLINRSGWTCTQPGGRIKTTTAGGLTLSQRQLELQRTKEGNCCHCHPVILKRWLQERLMMVCEEVDAGAGWGEFRGD
uniref:Chemokine-like protein TAFA-5 isoform X2 n=1 Tax=Geotrypetes seraphini TaxID=260995 RepID=A0A6P8S9Y3_GEOSA|nr:chemokine-like protein TAFA-5 isoform X2 [Geotrypetes seraphini]